MENPIKMDYLGVPLFLETPIYVFFFGWVGSPGRIGWTVEFNLPRRIYGRFALKGSRV